MPRYHPSFLHLYWVRSELRVESSGTGSWVAQPRSPTDSSASAAERTGTGFARGARRATAELLADSGDSGMPGEETLATARERAISVGAARPRDLCRGCAWRSDLVAAPGQQQVSTDRRRTHTCSICIASRPASPKSINVALAMSTSTSKQDKSSCGATAGEPLCEVAMATATRNDRRLVGEGECVEISPIGTQL